MSNKRTHGEAIVSKSWDIRKGVFLPNNEKKTLKNPTCLSDEAR